ncbi:MAG: helix-turn-helix domain-containing protein [Archaeoglobaceae archaeon]
MELKCSEHVKCILKCSFDISCFDMEVYVNLLKKNPTTVDDLADALNKDKSTVYKSLQKLLEKGLVERDYRILRSGGYKYLYKPINFEEFKKKIVEAVQVWMKDLAEFIQLVENLDREKIEGIILK